ncbi:MAG: hypothetical protein DDT39_01004 [Firmicutes bacterium]|nr:hypothetical protein [candidate division NPL-UPA2 bacterium]
MHLIAGTTRDGASLAELMNITGGSKRNFTPVTEESLLRLWGRGPGYASDGLLLVRDDTGQLLGATHALYDSAAQRGYLPFLLSRPDYEDLVWPILLSASEDHLRRATRLSIGSPYTPLYCALEGRFQPLWGTTEVMEARETDARLTAFLRESGFRLRYTHLSLTINLKPLPDLNNPLPAGRWETLRGAGCWENGYTWYGLTAAEEFGQHNHALNILLVREDYRVIGHITWYPMRQKGKAAICDVAVTKRLRGRGIGSYLLHSALTHLYQLGFSEVELCTTPALSKAAYRLYLRAGFETAATWLEMSKPLHPSLTPSL